MRSIEWRFDVDASRPSKDFAMSSDSRPTRRHFIACGLAGMSPAAWSQGALGGGKPLRIVVGFAPGGNIDTTARILADSWSKTLGEPVIVDNRPGAGGIVGSVYVAQSPPDGRTFTLIGPNSMLIAPRLLPKPPFKLADFTPLGTVSDTSMVLVVNAADKATNIRDWLAQAKAQPGKKTIAHAGIGTANHLAIIRMLQEAHIDATVVAFKGSAPALSDLLGSHIDMVVDQVTSALPHIQGGKLRPLAVTTLRRSAALPDVPTLDENGFKGFDIATSAGLYGPAGLPDAMLAHLSTTLNAALADPVLIERLKKIGATPAPGDPASYRARLQAQDKAMAALVEGGFFKEDGASR
jgi:tripartite-type tricarboxylate transporter receptor subunit TctC